MDSLLPFSNVFNVFFLDWILTLAWYLLFICEQRKLVCFQRRSHPTQIVSAAFELVISCLALQSSPIYLLIQCPSRKSWEGLLCLPRRNISTKPWRSSCQSVNAEQRRDICLVRCERGELRGESFEILEQKLTELGFEESSVEPCFREEHVIVLWAEWKLQPPEPENSEKGPKGTSSTCPVA